MAKKKLSDVDLWLGRETDHIRKALENASRYFDRNDSLTVNTLEAVYSQESSFGSDSFLGKRGDSVAAGHFQLKSGTAKQYGLIVSKKNDQRFDIDYASSAAARYLKDLDSMFSKKTNLGSGLETTSFASKSLADKNMKQKEPRKGNYRCTEGHWRTIDDRRVFIYD